MHGLDTIVFINEQACAVDRERTELGELRLHYRLAAANARVHGHERVEREYRERAEIVTAQLAQLAMKRAAL